MIAIELQILLGAIILGGVVWFALWRLLGDKIGKGVKKESKKIIAKIKEEDKDE